DLLSVVARERDVVVGRRAEHRRLDVVQTANGVTAAARQPLIAGRRDAEHVEVARGSRAIVDDIEIAVDATEVTEFDRHPADDLVLHGSGELPAVHPLAPTA